MLERFDLLGEPVTSLDLKATLVGTGVRYPESVYQAVAGRARLEPPSNPYAANCFILPGEIAVHLHPNDESPFALAVDEDGGIALLYRDVRVAPVTFPAPSDYGSQTTAAGTPFGAIAILEGRATLAFFYLWGCQYVRTRETCIFCFQAMAEAAGYPMPRPTYAEVAEVVDWSLRNAGVEEVQITAGTLFASDEECSRYADILRAIEERVGLSAIPGEVYCYMTAPRTPSAVDQVFAAGADRVAYDLHVWDTEVHSRVAPGHARTIGRAAHLRALEYIADRYGPNRAVSAFVVGLEPLESMVAGAEYLASRGIVPAFSVWMPTPGSVTADCRPPDMGYYRRARWEYARLYKTYNLNPPGAPAGSHVSMCRDIYRYMDDILAEDRP